MGIDLWNRRFQRAPSVSGPSAPFHSHFPPTGSGWSRFFPRSVCAFGCTLAVAGLDCSAQGTGHPRKKQSFVKVQVPDVGTIGKPRDLGLGVQLGGMGIATRQRLPCFHRSTCDGPKWPSSCRNSSRYAVHIAKGSASSRPTLIPAPC
jgi:hypothetical protein